MKSTVKWTLTFLVFGLAFTILLTLPFSKSEPDTKIYDYSEDVGVDRWAYYRCEATGGLNPENPPFGTEFTSPMYSEVSTSNDVWANCSGEAKYSTLLYKIEVSDQFNVTELNWLAETHVAGGATFKYNQGHLWNFTSSAWFMLYQGLNELTDVTRQGNISSKSAIDDYISGGIMYWTSHSSGLFGDYKTKMFNDYVTFNITYTVLPDETPPDITIFTPTNITYNASDRIELNYSVNENVSYVLYSLNGVNYTYSEWINSSDVKKGLINHANGPSGIYDFWSNPSIGFNATGTDKWELIHGVANDPVSGGVGPYGYLWNGTSWEEDASIVTGISLKDELGGYEAYSLCYNCTGNESWEIIAAGNLGTEPDAYGLYWDGSTWVGNTEIVVGLTGIGFILNYGICYNCTENDKWSVITGDEYGNPYGAYWNGTGWTNVSYSQMLRGVQARGYAGGFDFCYNCTQGLQTMIQGGDSVRGYYWKGNKWILDSDIVRGVDLNGGGAGSDYTPAICNNCTGTESWELIVGEDYGNFHGYYWGLSTVQRNITIIAREGQHSVYVCANDTANNWNCSNTVVFTVVNTCSCFSIQAGTTIDCFENCDIGACDADGKDITINGTGHIVVSGDVTNWGRLLTKGTDSNNKCIIVCGGGCFK